MIEINLLQPKLNPIHFSYKLVSHIPLKGYRNGFLTLTIMRGKVGSLFLRKTRPFMIISN